MQPLLASRPLVAVGLISYSLYLWHQPVYAFARIRSIDALRPGEYAVLIGVSLLLAALSWRLVERPFRDRSRVPARTIWLAAAAGMLIMLGVGAYGHVTSGVPQRFVEDRELMKYLAREAKVPKQQKRKKGPVIGDLARAPTQALIGDSHAGMIWKPYAKELEARGQAALFRTRPGCAWALGVRRIDRESDCDKWATGVLELLRQPQITTVILVGRYVNLLENRPFDNGEGGVSNEPVGYAPVARGRWLSDDAARRRAVAERYRESVQQLLELGKRVVLIYPVPEAGWDVPLTLFKMRRAGDARPLTTSHEVYRVRSRAVLEAFDAIGEHPNLVRVLPDRVLCNVDVPGRCLTHAGREIFYKDNNHLARRGADRLVAAMFAAMDQAWGRSEALPDPVPDAAPAP